MNRRLWRRRTGLGRVEVLVMFLIMCGLIFVFWNGGTTDGRKAGFRSGQIGALSGNDIRYELVEQPDGSKTWELIEKP